MEVPLGIEPRSLVYKTSALPIELRDQTFHLSIKLASAIAWLLLVSLVATIKKLRSGVA